METRELYKQKYEAQFDEWNAKLEVMQAQAEKLTAEAKLDVMPHLDSSRAKFGAAKAKLHAVAGAADDKWNIVVHGVDEAWNDVKAATQGLYDALKHHEKS